MALRFSKFERILETTRTETTVSRGRGSTAHGRARVSASCCRDRYSSSRLREARRLPTQSGSRPSCGRELHLEVTTSDDALSKDGTERPSASSDRAMIPRTNPSNWWGSPEELRMASRWDRGRAGQLPACGTEGRSLGSLCEVVILHGGAGCTRLWLRHSGSRLSERRARDNGAATKRSEAKIETYFALSRHAGTSSPGATNPIEKRRSGRSELGRRETSGSFSRNGKYRQTYSLRAEENRERGLARDR